ncbi:MAG TPA: TetR/AcrR family transcriptional regulator, partial [Microthrixaceae bacterium]|nr:TetR/AcrR family transcriptional regulator [Microthrixaceae bacterium]
TATRSRVLAAVSSLLESGGPSEVTHSSVARAAKVGRATVYRHWPRIDDLLADAIETRLGVTPPGTTGNALTDLRSMLLAIVAGVFSDDSAVFFTTLLVQGGDTPQMDALRREIIERRMGAIRDLVERGAIDGSIDPTLDPDRAISYLAGPIMHRRIVLGQPVTPDFIDDLLLRVAATPP